MHHFIKIFKNSSQPIQNHLIALKHWGSDPRPFKAIKQYLEILLVETNRDKLLYVMILNVFHFERS